MKNLMLVFVLVSFFAFISCSSAPTLQIINLDAAKNAVQGYYESGAFERECERIIDDAINRLETIPLKKNMTVVFDIDETALSNYDHTKEIGFGYVPKLWTEWLLKADAKAIPQTKRFYDWLISKNIGVIFLTGRYEETRDATIKNLFDQGYTKFDTLIVRRNDERTIPAAKFKALKREELVMKGYEIIACIGDQWSDLIGGNTGYKIKLPNYLYLID